MERSDKKAGILGDEIILPPEVEGYLQVRYLKLHFYLEILRDGYLPKSKASALRGGMGQMLLMINCIRDGNCESCDFEDDCLVRRMMYPKMEIRPNFMTRQDSEGYVLECENVNEFFAGGQLLEFNLVLFGKSIAYYSQYLQAFHYLGMQGLGKGHVPFRVKRVTNSRGKIIVEGNNVYKENIEIMMLADYVRYRLARTRRFSEGFSVRNNDGKTAEDAIALREIDGESYRESYRESYGKDHLVKRRDTAAAADPDTETRSDVETLLFHSPLSLKYKGDVQKCFSPEALLAAIERRLYILNCFEGRKEGEDYRRIHIAEHIPLLLEQKAFTEKVTRYSGTQNAKLSFYGIEGYCRLDAIDEIARALLIAGELVHIGKNTSFGFGRYTLVTAADRSRSKGFTIRE